MPPKPSSGPLKPDGRSGGDSQRTVTTDAGCSLQVADERNTWTSSRSSVRATAPAPDPQLAEDRRLDAQRGLYNGFGESYQRAIEYAAVPPVFGLVGWWLEGRLGWRPVLTIMFVLYAVVGLAIRTYFAYNARMIDEEGRLP